MEQSPEDFKVGKVIPGNHHEEIRYDTPEGTNEVITGIFSDPDNPQLLRATRYSYNEETKETKVERGYVRGHITEAGQFVWEHKKEISAAASVAVSVVVGTLWVRHRRKK